MIQLISIFMDHFQKKGPNKEFLQRQIENAKMFKYFAVVWQGPIKTRLHTFHPDTVKLVLRTSDGKGQVYHRTLKPWLGKAKQLNDCFKNQKETQYVNSFNLKFIFIFL